jgi:hypothetical protein
MMVLGIDPGKTGGFAVLDGDSVIVEPMPANDDGIDLPELNRLLRHYADHVTLCYLEMAGMRPKQSTQSTFAFGRNFGIIEGMLSALHIKYKIIRPDTWSKNYEHGVTEKVPAKRKAKIKVARRGIVAKLYPGIDLRKSERSSTPDEGMVDALLIADFGWNQQKHMWKDAT